MPVIFEGNREPQGQCEREAVREEGRGMRRCNTCAPHRNWTCSRPTGHEGEHVAAFSDGPRPILMRWS